jgi:tetratricopeptide (TPR) repeat protein
MRRSFSFPYGARSRRAVRAVRSRPLELALALALAGATFGCASVRSQQAPPARAPAGVTHYEMDPMVLEATPGPTGIQIDSFDAQELFEQGGASLSQNRFDDAIRLYDRLLEKFPSSVYARPAFYNRGLAHRDKKDWPRAIESFRALAEKWPDHADAKDALFQLGACYAEMENWPTSGEIFARLLDRKDLTADDRIEAIARRAFAQLKVGDLDTAEKTFRSVLAYRAQIAQEERLATDFYLAFSQYNLGQITHERFRRVPIRLPEGQMDQDIEEKASLLLKAQRSYIETIKFGNPRWASAAGFQVGSLYEELYDAFMSAPIPPDLEEDARKAYQEELRKKIRVLLEKSLRWYRENLLMVERLGVDTDWAEKTKLAYSKLLRLLDPAAPDISPSAPDSSSDADHRPTAPAPPPGPDRPNPRGSERPGQPAIERQIL